MRTYARLLKYLGIAIIFLAIMFIANFCDFMHILFTGRNLDLNTFKVLGPLCYMFVPLSGIIFVYIAVELIFPERELHKKLILSFFIIISILFELLLFLDTANSAKFIEPSISGEDLIDDSIIIGSPFFFVALFSNLGLNIVLGIGFLVKGLYSKGLLMKKSILLSIGFIIFLIGLIIDGTFNLAIFRVLILIGFWIMYLGLREEPAEKLTYEKKVHVEGGIFPISEYRREDITEEEVSISKEKQICLVCKGSVSRFNIYLCPICRTFYCSKCSQALIDSENACWVCETPFDEFKPVKPYKREEEIDIEISEKAQKKSKKYKKSS